MLEVKIPIEIQSYKSKVIAGLTVRQLIAIGGAFMSALPIGVFGRGHISSDILPWFIIAIAVPWVMWGFFTFQGLMFEDFFRSWLTFYLSPTKRVYEDTDGSLLQELHEQLLEEQILMQRVESGEYELVQEE